MPDNDDDLSAPTYIKGGEPTAEFEQDSADLIYEFKSSNDASSGLKNKLLSRISEENTSREMSTV